VGQLKLGTASIVRANSRHLPLADNSVDLVVTSPPYFALRSYQDGGEHYAGQIGDEPTPAEFVAALLEVTEECVRVLKPTGSLWVNLGDKYAGPNMGGARAPGPRGGMQGAPVQKFSTLGAPTKSLIGIPWRYALRCIDDLGLILRAEVIWSKPNGLPESVTDRVRRSHEQWFHFTLEPRYFSAVDEIREPHAPWTLKAYAYEQANDYKRKSNADRVDRGNAKDYAVANPLGKLPGSVWTVPTEPLRVPDHLGIDHFAAFPTEWPRRIINGWSPAGVCTECGEGRRPVVVTGDYEQAGHGGNYAATPYSGDDQPSGIRNGQGASTLRTTAARTITGYACTCTATEHGPVVGAAVPTCTCGRTFSTWRAQGIHETAERRKGTTPLPPTTPGVVLDPFGGTGTTALVAKALGRHGITVDMSADYCRLAEWRTNDRNQLAKVLGIEKAEQQDADQLDLFEETA
jgi:DNA modification methylase